MEWRGDLEIETATPTEGSAPASETDMMGAVWDKAMSEGVEDAQEAEPEPDGKTEEAPVEAADKPDAEAAEKEPEQEPAPEPVAAPTDIPKEIAEHWADMTPEVRDAVAQTQRRLSQRMAEQGQVVTAAKPVYDVLVQAAKDIPELAQQSPEVIAQDALALAKVRASLSRAPVETVLQLAQNQGFLPQLAARIRGEAPNETAQALQQALNEIASLKGELQKVTDPARVSELVEGKLTEDRTQQEINQFAEDHKEMWPEVEPHIVTFGPIARDQLGSEAPARDVLALAYDMAVHAIPSLREKVKPAAPAVEEADPQKTAESLRAASVNVRSQSSGKPKPLTERQQMAAAWDRLTAS